MTKPRPDTGIVLTGGCALNVKFAQAVRTQRAEAPFVGPAPDDGFDILHAHVCCSAAAIALGGLAHGAALLVSPPSKISQRDSYLAFQGPFA